MTYRHCGRPLTSEESRARGAGHTCSEKHRTSPDHPELFDTMERQQRPKREPEVVDWDDLMKRKETTK